MFKRQSPQAPRASLPFYLNDTLPPAERREVESWLQKDPTAQADLAAWQQIRAAAAGQAVQSPSPAGRRQLMAQVRSARRLPGMPRWLPWAGGLALALAAVLVLWAVFQPGIGLQWTVSGSSVTAFRIYRAPMGSDNFQLVREVPARPGAQDYTYVDPVVLPSQTYIYRVEGVSQGQSALSPTLALNGAEAMRMQLLILMTGLVVGCVAAFLTQQLRSVGWNTTGLAS